MRSNNFHFKYYFGHFLIGFLCFQFVTPNEAFRTHNQTFKQSTEVG